MITTPVGPKFVKNDGADSSRRRNGTGCTLVG